MFSFVILPRKTSVTVERCDVATCLYVIVVNCYLFTINYHRLKSALKWHIGIIALKLISLATDVFFYCVHFPYASLAIIRFTLRVYSSFVPGRLTILSSFSLQRLTMLSVSSYPSCSSKYSNVIRVTSFIFVY